MKSEPKIKVEAGTKRKPKRTCPICKTSKFRATEDGLVCRYGHKVLDVQLEMQEEPGRLGGFKRRNAKKERIELKVPQAKKQSDLMTIIQFALQAFSKCMVEDLGFPSELEAVVRELWLLYLSGSKRELYESYLFEANEKQLREMKVKKEEIKIKLEKDEEALEALLASEDDQEEETPLKGRISFQSHYEWPSVEFGASIVFLYLACTYLRLPILLDDLIRWCKTDRIPYFSIQKRIPLKVFSFGQDKSYSLSFIPTKGVLDETARILYNAFKHRTKLIFPPFNISLCIERFCNQFYLPVQGYYYADYLYETYRRSHRVRRLSPHHVLASHQALVAMACVIAAAKIIYQVNGNNKYLRSLSKHNIMLDKASWLEKITEKIDQWKKINSGTEDMDLVLQNIRDSTTRYRVRFAEVDKHGMIANLLDQIQGEARTSSTAKPHVDLFVESHQFVKNEAEFLVRPILDEGLFYYSCREGFRPEEHIKLLELGIQINDEAYNGKLERLLRRVEALLYKNSVAVTHEEVADHYDVPEEMQSLSVLRKKLK